MSQINPTQVLYIKLGKGGKWEEECIKNGTLRLGYNEAPHEACIQGQWEKVQKAQLEIRNKASTATRDTTQICYFYEADENTLWFTFWKNDLWWTFSKPEIKKLIDGTKIRNADGWKNVDTEGKLLTKSRLSGKLLAIQRYPGTICKVKESEYIVNKINGIDSPEIIEATQALSQLEQKIEAVIRKLTWQDFELLIDLLFRQSGLQRLSALGGTQKTLDLDLLSPITSERFGIQVKAKANTAVFEKYRLERLQNMEGFTRFYFAVHSPSKDLIELADPTELDHVELLLPADIAHLSVCYGLTQWIIDKAG